VSAEIKKKGRPASYEHRAKLKLINFKADPETLVAIERLVEEQRTMTPAGDLGKLQSAAIRRALQLAASMIGAIEKR